MYMKKTIINTNGQQFNQYKQNEQLSLTLKTTTQKDHIHIPMWQCKIGHWDPNPIPDNWVSNINVNHLQAKNI